MKKPTSCARCERDVLAQGLCAYHYRKAHRSGEIVSTRKRRPSLSNVDTDAMTCDCPVHGPGSRLRVRPRKRGAYHVCRECDRGPRPVGRDPRAKASKQARRAAMPRYKYGLTMEEFQLRIEAQQGLCAICENPLDRPMVDHDHDKGHVRGILCNSCNVGLGWFRDNPTALSRAALYIRRNAEPR